MTPVFVEGLRRIVAAGCLFAGIWLVLQPGGPLIVARVVDFSREFAASPYVTARAGTLADFIRRRTDGRVLEATGTPWAGFITALRDGTADGQLQRLSGYPGEIVLVFRPEAMPGPLDGRLPPFWYVHLPSADLWVSLSVEHARDIAGLERRWAHPHRLVGLWLLPLAILAYFIPPRSKVPPGGLVYSRIQAVVLPDLLGLLGGGFFFALALLIVADNAPGQPPWSWEGGWAWLTGILWLMAAGFLSLTVVGFRYATLHLAITEAALIVARSLRSWSYAWDAMESCRPYQSSRGAVVGILLILVAQGPAMVGQGLLVAANRERGLEIRMKDGRTLRIMANSLPGFARVVEALRRHGIDGASLLED